MNTELSKTPNDYEVCALCGCVTDVKIKMTIDARKYYVDGVGQLCCKCFTIITGQNADDNDE